MTAGPRILRVLGGPLAALVLAAASAASAASPKLRKDAPMSLDAVRESFVRTHCDDVDLIDDELREKDGATYWLAVVRPKRAGELVFRRTFETPGFGYPYHDNESRVFVLERGARRKLRHDLRPQQLCVGDSLVVPILVGDGITRLAFRKDSRFPVYYTSDFETHLDDGPIPSAEIVRSSAGAPLLRYLGRDLKSSVHRAGTRTTMHFTAFFQAVGPGELTLELSARLPEALLGERTRDVERRLTTSIVVVPAESPITAVVVEESVLGKDSASETPRVSSAGGTSYPTRLLMVRPGDTFSLTYADLVAPSHEEALRVARGIAPVVRALPFTLDTTSDFTSFLRPFLRFRFSTEPMPDGPSCWYHQDSVEWTGPGDVVLWKARLPERMRRYQAGIGDAEVEAHAAFPRSLHGLSFLVGLVEGEGAAPFVALADATGVLSLQRSDGSVLLDYEAEGRDVETRERLWFDSGTYTISGACTGSGPARGARFLARCGRRLVYFNGSTLAVFSTDEPRLLGETRFDPKRHERRVGPGTVAARIPLLDLEVALDGIVHLR